MGSKRVAGSCVWFKPHLQAFLTAEAQPILTIVGGPGVGKSVLAGWILNEVETQEQGKPSKTVLQFFISKL